MDGIVYEGDWEEVKKRMMEKYPALLEEDLEAENDDNLLIHLNLKLGKSKAELREIIRNI
jgi:hypothetical protein